MNSLGQLTSAAKIAFAHRADFLATINGNRLELWSYRDGPQFIQRVDMKKDLKLPHVNSLDISPDDAMIVLKNTRGRIKVIDRETLTLRCDFGGTKREEGCAARFSADNAKVIDGSWDGALQARDAATGEPVDRRDFQGCMLCGLSPDRDRQRFALLVKPKSYIGDQPNPEAGPPYVLTFDEALQQEMRVELGDTQLPSITLSPDGRLLSNVFYKRSEAEGHPPTTGCRIVSVQENETLWELEVENLSGENRLAWTPDSERFALCTKEQTALYAPGATDPLEMLKTPKANQVAFSRCGKYLAVAAGSGNGKRSLLFGV